MPFFVTMPKLSPTMEEGTIAKWHKKVGDKVRSGDLLLEIATDKATLEHFALDEGYLRKILVHDGCLATVNQPIAIFTEKAHEKIEEFFVEKQEEPHPVVEKHKKPSQQETITPLATMKQADFSPEPPLEGYEFSFPTDKIQGRVKASPLAQKLAREQGLDLTTVKGTGPRGRIVKDDLELAQPNNILAFGRREVPELPPGTYEEISLTPMKKIIGQRLQESKAFIPHFYVRQEIDALPLTEVRNQLKTCEIKVTLNDFIIRAVAISLREHPLVNAGFNLVHQTIISFKTVDISVAVVVEGGLITPIIRHADYKNLGEISVEVKELANKAKNKKLQPEEYKGGSFTISNLGMFGISDFSAIINPPQAAILAVGGIEECVRMKNGSIVSGKKMMLTLSVDHRVIDGAEAAKFMKTVQKYLEAPASLLL